MLLALAFFVILSPVWGYGLYWIFEEIFRPDPREDIDWPLVSLGFLLLLVSLGVTALVWFDGNRTENFMSECASRGLTREECHVRWYGERHRR